MLTGCGGDTEGTDNDDSDSTEETRYDDYDDDDDDDDDNDNTSSIDFHNQGQACLSCHAAPATLADGEDFLSGGTVYTTLNGNSSQSFASGYTIRLALSNGISINYEYDNDGGTANSYSENSTLLNNYTFTAQVVNTANEVVNTSTTNSHNTSTYLNCNSCHTIEGTNGAPGRILSLPISSLPTTTETNTTATLTFVNDVYPILQSSCSTVGCHDEASANNFIVSTDSQTYSNISPFISTPAVDSVFLTKANNSVTHGGGKVLDTTAPEYITIRDWMDAGAIFGIVAEPIVAPSTLSFSTNIMPLLETSCKACHGSSGNFTITTPSATHDNITSFSGINTATPENSSLLTKSIGVNHGGGSIWSTTHSSYVTVKEWITQGALNN